MRFFVTGGAGYIGSHFVWEAARQGHECLVYDSLERGHREAVPPGVALTVGNVLDGPALAASLRAFRPDVVLHYAAYAIVPESVQYPEKYFTNNVGGVESLIGAMVAAGTIVPLVFSSTCAVFGTPKTHPLTEDAPKNPESPYGASKLQAEGVIAKATATHGFAAMALRYFNACGADASGLVGEAHDPETHLIPNILRAVRAGDQVTIYGNDFPTADGTCVRDYIHVTDLAISHIQAAAYLRGLKGKGSFDTVLLGTGRGQSNMEILKAAAAVTGKQPDVVFGPRRPGDPAQLTCDPSKAARLLGFKALHSDVENIIATAWRWELARSAY